MQKTRGRNALEIDMGRPTMRGTPPWRPSIDEHKYIKFKEVAPEEEKTYIPTLGEKRILRCPSCKPGAIDATKLRLRNSLTWIALKCESCQVRKISKHWKCACGNPWYTCAIHASPLFGPVTRPQKKRPDKRKYVAFYKGAIENRKMKRKNGNNVTDTVLRPCAGHDNNVTDTVLRPCAGHDNNMTNTVLRPCAGHADYDGVTNPQESDDFPGLR